MNKKNIVYIFIVVVLTSLYLQSCDSYENEGINEKPVITENTGNANVTLAKEWFEKQNVSSLYDRGNTSGNSLICKGEPSWKYYSVYDKGSIITVDVDITDRICLDIVTNANLTEYESTNELKYRRSYSRFVYMLNKEEQKETGFMMTIIPSKKYIDEYGDAVQCNTYMHRSEHLSGYVLFHNINGAFVNGWEYNNGKIKGKISSQKTINSDSISLNSLSADYIVKSSNLKTYSVDDDSIAFYIELAEVIAYPNRDYSGSAYYSMIVAWLAAHGNSGGYYDGDTYNNYNNGGGGSGSNGGNGDGSGTNEALNDSIDPQSLNYDQIENVFTGVCYLSANAFYNMLGGNALYNYTNWPNNFRNTCAMKMSYVCNQIGYTIPKAGAGNTLSADADKNGKNEYYLYKVSDMISFFDSRLGTGEHLNLSDIDNLRGRTGIICFGDCNFSDATGHMDMWDGESVVGHDYSNNCDSVIFWEIQN